MTQADAGVELDEAVRFQRDLYLYWRAAQGDGLPLTTRRYVTRPALRALRERLRQAQSPTSAATDASTMDDLTALAEPDDLRLFFLRRLLERLGLLRDAADAADAAEGTRLVATAESEMARFLAHALSDRLRICARLWVAAGWWPDRPDRKHEPPPLLTPAPPHVALARRRLIETLAHHAEGQPLTVPPGPRTERASRAAKTRAMRQHDSARRSAPLATEQEAETVRAALLGPLAWMGFVSVGAGVGDGVCATTGALVALRHDAADAPDMLHTGVLAESAGRVLVQPSYAVLAYPPLTAPALYTLDTLAAEDALDTVARYHLTRDAFARACRAGWSAEVAAQALERLSGDALPPNVRIALDDWERHTERIQLTADVRLLEVASARLLDALLADRAMGAWIERRLTPATALLRAGGALPVRAWLLRHGELPAMRAGPPTEREGPRP